MATVTLTIPNDQVQRVLDAMAGVYGYQSTIPDEDGDPIANPESLPVFAKRMIALKIKNQVKDWEVRQASLTALADVESNLEIEGT